METLRLVPPASDLPNQKATLETGFRRFIRWTIEEELPAAESFLEGDELKAFRHYYRNLPKPGEERAINRCVLGMWRGEVGSAARWIAARATRDTGEAGFSSVQVLDAGSGFGTFAMLFAALGASVTGVDLRSDRLSVSQKRLFFYRERTGEELPVRFARNDLTLRWERDYDLVWAYNALSHIDPLDDFLRRVRDHLRPGGVLVVGDINGANPGQLKRLAKLRTEVHQTYLGADGIQHGYAVERPLPPRELRALLARQGLKVLQHELWWGGLGVLPNPVYDGVMKPLQSKSTWWVGNRVARRQLLVAEKLGEPA